jgi:hypothetical protein
VQVLYNFGREDAASREALQRLAASVARHLDPGKAREIAAEELEFAESRPLGGTWVLDVARMDAEVKALLNTTLGGYSDDYRGTVRRIITGTLEECVRRGVIPRHTLAGLELAPRIVTAARYEQQDKGHGGRRR